MKFPRKFPYHFPALKTPALSIVVYERRQCIAWKCWNVYSAQERRVPKDCPHVRKILEIISISKAFPDCRNAVRGWHQGSGTMLLAERSLRVGPHVGHSDNKVVANRRKSIRQDRRDPPGHDDTFREGAGSFVLLWSNLRSRFEGSRARTPRPERMLAASRIASMSFVRWSQERAERRGVADKVPRVALYRRREVKFS